MNFKNKLAHCSFDQCPNKPKTRGLCRRHYALARRQGLEPLPKPERCSQCDLPVNCRGFCKRHYNQARQAGLFDWIEPCSVATCASGHFAKGYCQEHYDQWKLHGDPLVRRHARKGSGYIRKDGATLHRVDGRLRADYRVIMETHLGRSLLRGEHVRHINQDKSDNRIENLEVVRVGVGYLSSSGYRMIQRDGRTQLEHRYIMAQHLGRELLPNEDVHHRNGVRNDNQLENLELWSHSQPRGQRVVDKVAWATEILSLYKDYARSGVG